MAVLTPTRVPTRGPSPRLAFAVIGGLAAGIVAFGVLGSGFEERSPEPSGPPPSAALATPSAPAPSPASRTAYSGPVNPRTGPVERLYEGTALEPTGLTIVRPEGENADAVMAVDGSVWISRSGSLLRVDPTTGETRTWSLADDRRFGGGGIAAASAGGVWLVGPDGVRRFDGTAFREAYALARPPSIATEGPDGTLWVACADGSVAAISRVRGRAPTATWVFLGPDEPGAPLAPDDIAVDASGGVWIAATESGRYPRLARFDGRAWTDFPTLDPDRRTDAIDQLVPATDGTIWVLTGDAAERMGPAGWIEGGWLGAWSPTSLAITDDGARWMSIAVADERAILMRRVGRDGAVTDWRGTRGGAFADEASRATVVARGREVALVTGAGVYRPEGGGWRRVALLDEPGPAERLVAMGEREAYATVGGRVLRLGPRGATTIETPADAGAAQDLVADGSGRLWVAADRALLRRDGTGWERIGPHATALAPDSNGGVVALRDLASGGFVVDRYAADRRSILIPHVDLLTQASRVAIGADGTVWVGSSGAAGPGLARYQDREWALADIRGAGLAVAIADVAVTPNGAVWAIGRDLREMDGGYAPSTSWLARLRDGRWTTWLLDEAGYETSGAIGTGPGGTVWFATSSGLVRTNGVEWVRVALGVPVREVSVAPDGTVWVVTPSGTGWLDPDTAVITATGKKP